MLMIVLVTLNPIKKQIFIVLDLNASELIKQKIQTVTDISDLLFCLMMLGDDRLVGEVYILGQCDL